jgi:hypothetical protein
MEEDIIVVSSSHGLVEHRLHRMGGITVERREFDEEDQQWTEWMYIPWFDPGSKSGNQEAAWLWLGKELDWVGEIIDIIHEEDV